MKTVTMRGVKFDMARLVAQNANKMALGNASMNARGDIVGKGGTVKIFREQIAREYHRANPKAVKQVPLRNINQEITAFDTPAEAVAKSKGLLAQQRETTNRPKRKIAD